MLAQGLARAIAGSKRRQHRLGGFGNAGDEVFDALFAAAFLEDVDAGDEEAGGLGLGDFEEAAGEKIVAHHMGVGEDGFG